MELVELKEIEGIKVHLIVREKEWIRCYVCGDGRVLGSRKRIPKIYRGRMYFKNGKYECNKCDFSFAPKDLEPKQKMKDIVNIMKTI